MRTWPIGWTNRWNWPRSSAASRRYWRFWPETSRFRGVLHLTGGKLSSTAVMVIARQAPSGEIRVVGMTNSHPTPERYRGPVILRRGQIAADFGTTDQRLLDGNEPNSWLHTDPW